MRVELGLLQMEATGRPDGARPGGAATYLDDVKRQAAEAGEPFELSENECLEIDREFIQFYHRRICYLALREFRRALADAEHTLALMDFAAAHSPNTEWTLSHEQYRPFVLFHHAQAAALSVLQESGPEEAIEEVNRGMDRIREIFVAMGAEEQFDGDELVKQLVELKDSLRNEYHVGRTLAEQLADAISAEQYERAARLRDEIARRAKGN
jgi:hypothetical protein